MEPPRSRAYTHMLFHYFSVLASPINISRRYFTYVKRAFFLLLCLRLSVSSNFSGCTITSAYVVYSRPDFRLKLTRSLLLSIAFDLDVLIRQFNSLTSGFDNGCMLAPVPDSHRLNLQLLPLVMLQRTIFRTFFSLREWNTVARTNWRPNH